MELSYPRYRANRGSVTHKLSAFENNLPTRPADPLHSVRAVVRVINTRINDWR